MCYLHLYCSSGFVDVNQWMLKIVSHIRTSSGSGFAGLTMPGDFSVQIITVISREVNEY